MSASLEDLFGEQAPGAPDPEAESWRERWSSPPTPTTPTSARPEPRPCSRRPGGRSATSSSPTARRAPTTRSSRPRPSSPRATRSSATPHASSASPPSASSGYTDGELTYSRELLGDITREIRAFRPHAVYTHDPEPVIHDQGFINHNDHRLTGLATVDAVYPTARDRLNFPEHLEDGLETHKVAELYLWGSNKASFDVDISAVVETKIEALMAHVSQFGDRDEFVEFALERWRDDDGRYLESFRQW